MNLAEWARLQGIRPQTAYSWFKSGTLPVPAVRINDRFILVGPEGASAKTTEGLGLYARCPRTTSDPISTAR